MIHDCPTDVAIMGGGSSKDQAATTGDKATDDKATGDTANGTASTDRSPHTTRSQLMLLSRAVNNYAIAQYQVFSLKSDPEKGLYHIVCVPATA